MRRIAIVGCRRGAARAKFIFTCGRSEKTVLTHLADDRRCTRCIGARRTMGAYNGESTSWLGPEISPPRRASNATLFLSYPGDFPAASVSWKLEKSSFRFPAEPSFSSAFVVRIFPSAYIGISLTSALPPPPRRCHDATQHLSSRATRWKMQKQTAKKTSGK